MKIKDGIAIITAPRPDASEKRQARFRRELRRAGKSRKVSALYLDKGERLGSAAHWIGSGFVPSAIVTPERAQEGAQKPADTVPGYAPVSAQVAETKGGDCADDAAALLNGRHLIPPRAEVPAAVAIREAFAVTPGFYSFPYLRSVLGTLYEEAGAFYRKAMQGREVAQNAGYGAIVFPYTDASDKFRSALSDALEVLRRDYGPNYEDATAPDALKPEGFPLEADPPGEEAELRPGHVPRPDIPLPLNMEGISELMDARNALTHAAEVLSRLMESQLRRTKAR
jgi:hypothetical protein